MRPNRSVTRTWVVRLLLVVFLAAAVDFSPFSYSKTEAYFQQDAPVVSGLAPSAITNDLNTYITITGSGFALSPVPDVLLDGTPIPNAARVDDTHLSLLIPWGKQPGAYALTVRNPDGQQSSPVSLTITDGFNHWMTNGPYGGQVHRMVIDPVNTNRIFASLRGVGIFRSSDGGSSWNLVLVTNNNSDLAFDSGSLYANSIQDGLVRSDDYGSTWTPVNYTMGPWGGFLYASPLLPGKVFIGDGEGLHASSDKGQTWNLLFKNDDSNRSVTAFAADPKNIDRLYVGLSDGSIYQRDNAQSSWSAFGKPDQFIYQIAVNPLNGDVWACGSDDNGHWGFLWRRRAGETTWSQVDNGLPEPRAFSLVFSPTGKIWASTFRATAYSVTDGASWVEVGPGVDKGSPNTLVLSPDNANVVYQGFAGTGVFKSLDDGATWVEKNQGLAGIHPSGIDISPDDPATIYMTAHGPGTYKMNNGSSAWKKLPSWNSWARTPRIDVLNHQRLYVGGTNQVLVTEDDGQNWWQEGPPQPPAGYENYQPEVGGLIQLPGSGRLILGVGFIAINSPGYIMKDGAIYYSEGAERGLRWTLAGSDVILPPITRLAYAPSNPNIVYAGGKGIWKSIDGGLHWQKAGMDGREIMGLAVNDQDPSRVYVTSTDGLYILSGPDWVHVSDMAGQSASGQLLWVPGQFHILYNYSWSGLSQSYDEGQTWSRAPGSLAYANVGAMDFYVDGSRLILYVGVAGGVTGGNTNAIASYASASPGLLGAGVYRFSTHNRKVYLPAVGKK